MLLRSAYATSLRLADDAGCHSIAFPSLGTGAYSYPLAEAAPIALATVADHLQARSGLALVIFVLYSADSYAAFVQALDKVAR